MGLAFAASLTISLYLVRTLNLYRGQAKQIYKLAGKKTKILAIVILSRAIFTLFSKDKNENTICEEDLMNFFSKETHYTLSWDSYILW